MGGVKRTGTNKAKPKGDGFSYSDWYQANKKTVLERRRLRYQQDKSYRDAIIGRRRKTLKENRERTVEELQKQLRGAAPDPKKDYRVSAGLVGGRPAKLYTRGYLADSIGQSRSTIYEWESSGVLPPPSFVDAKGHVWFTQEYVEFMRVCMSKFVVERTAASMVPFKDCVAREFRVRSKGRERI